MIQLDPKVKKVVNLALKNILKYPETFDMSTYVEHSQRRHPQGRYPANYCGTVGCLYGHIALAAGVPPESEVKLNKLPDLVFDKVIDRFNTTLNPLPSVVSTDTIVNALLDLDETHALVNEDEWPERFAQRAFDAREAKRRAKTPRAERVAQRAYAKAGVDRFRFFLRTGK